MKRINLPTPHVTVHEVNSNAEPRKLVLYVEDDADNREIASARLEKTYELILAADDKAACEAFIKYGCKISLILLDIELKGSQLNGVDLARLIRGKLNPSRIPAYASAVSKLDVPIIFVTAYGRSYPRADLLLAGGGEVINKPINFVQLHTAMARGYLNKRG
jgi:CheY-like chemotaxis protein